MTNAETVSKGLICGNSIIQALNTIYELVEFFVIKRCSIFTETIGFKSGFKIKKSKPSAKSIMTALGEAIDVTNDCRYRRTFHSDRGWAYQMNAYRYELKKNRIFQSMSRKGNCYDNSPMENFFGIMKQEMYYGKVYNSFDELKEAIDKYIRYYNEKRSKASLGYRSPIEYRNEMLAA